MAQMVSVGGSRSARVLTVADLLNRNGGAPARPRPAVAAPAVTVDSLLLREGHGALAPALPDERSSLVQVGGRRVVRASAVAVGTLLAAGSVLGSAVITDTAHSTADAMAGSYPGEGRLDAASGAQQSIGSVAQHVVAHALDPGIGAPDSWVPVAFPGAVAGVLTALAPASASHAPATAGSVADGNARHDAPVAQQAPPPATGGGLLGDIVQGVGDTLAPVAAPLASALTSSDSGSTSAGGGLVGGLTGAVAGLLG